MDDNYIIKKVSVDNVLLLDRTLFNCLCLSANEEILISIGRINFKVKVNISEIKYPSTILLSKNIFSKVPFPFHGPLKVICEDSHRIILGPSVGIITSSKTISNIQKSKVLKKRALLAMERGILLFIFTLKDIDWINNKVKSLIYNLEADKWVTCTVPIPHVIYNRGGMPKGKRSELYLEKSNLYNIQWINIQKNMGKWETYQALQKVKSIAPHLPETSLLNKGVLKKYIAKYKQCFIKSNYGSNGTKVFRLERIEEGYISKTGGSRRKSKKFLHLDSIFSYFNSNFSKPGNNLIVQQGITLGRIKNCPFDMRLLIQKDQNNNWCFTALNFRIGSPKAIVTNFSQGASDVLTFPGDKLLHSKLEWKSLRSLATKVALSLEEKFGMLGELGLDFALDNEGKLWILEINFSPSSAAYRNADEKMSNIIYGNPLDYSIFLIKNNLLKYN